MEESTTTSFGDMLQRFRKRRKLSQQKLAKNIEMSRASISLWERGLEYPGTRGIMSKLADKLFLDEVERRLLFEAWVETPAILPSDNLPDKNPYFTGREAVLENLHQRLTEGKEVALKQAISGLGGVGKTQIALEYAYRYKKSYHDILWASADSDEELVNAYAGLAEHLLLPEWKQQNRDMTTVAVKRWLSTHNKWLLILDNIEDISLVGKFVPAIRQGGSVLLTTQLQVTEPIAQSIEVDMMLEEEGALFLLKRAAYLELGSMLDDSCELDIAVAKDITREMGGLPLALDQAGAYILETKCSLIDYLTLYTQRRYAILQRRGRVYKGHQESVSATFSLAFKRLVLKKAAASELLRLFAFLAPDSIPEEIVHQGISLGTSLLQSLKDELEFNEAIESLLSLSLIHRNSVRETLNERNSVKETFSVHRLVQVVLKETMDEVQQRGWAECAIRAINRVFPDVQETEEWYKCQRCLPHALFSRKLIHEWRFEFEEAAELLHRLGNYLRESTQGPQVVELYNEALAIYEGLSGLGDFEIKKAYIIHDRGRLHSYHFQTYGKAERDYSTALRELKKRSEATPEILKATSDRIAQIYNDLGALYLQQGEYSRAKEYFEAPAICELRNEFHKATVTAHLAACFAYLKQYEEAEQKYNELMKTISKLPLRHHAWIYNNMAFFYLNRGRSRSSSDDYKKAETYCLKSFEILEELLTVQVDNYPPAAFPLLKLVEIYEAQSKYAEAETYFKRALNIRERTFDHHLIVSSHCRFAQFYENWGVKDKSESWTAEAHIKQAKAHYEQALEICKELPESDRIDTAPIEEKYLKLSEMLKKKD